jgi:hypothetical protein
MATISPPDIHNEPPAMDYASHQRQFRRFLHLVKWAIIHFALLLPGLYFLIIGHQTITGMIFVALAVTGLAYGVVSTQGITRDVVDVVEQRPERMR